MVENTERAARPRSEKTIVIDADYIRDQAGQAIRIFVAPLTGVIAAAFGPIGGHAGTTARKDKKRR